MPGHKGIAGLIFGMVSMLFGNAVLFIQPVLDAWYYGASFIIIASVLITLINVIRAFNVLTQGEQTEMLRLVDKYVTAIQEQIDAMRGVAK